VSTYGDYLQLQALFLAAFDARKVGEREGYAGHRKGE